MASASFTTATRITRLVRPPRSAETVLHGQATIVVSSLSAPSVFGQPVSFQAVVTPGIAGTLDGTVTFNADGAAIGTATIDAGGIARVTTTSALAVGAHTISADYSGNATLDPDHRLDKPSSSTTAATTTSLASSSNPVAATGGAARHTATVTPVAPGAGTVSGTVTFKDGATILGTINVGGDGIASVRASSLTDGSHAITATSSTATRHFTTSNASPRDRGTAQR